MLLFINIMILLFIDILIFILGGEILRIGKYNFEYIQTIKPLTDEIGNIYRYSPQSRYNNKKNLKLHNYGDGEFCIFKLENANVVSGVYAWIIKGEASPIYIGEAKNFRKRFNTGYGIISPRNCFVGGQITNCKMNKVVLDSYDKGLEIDIYFLKTLDYKNIELELLSEIKTIYNNKNN